jgi:8-oxo-dGTP pyrophosphatase MutT (NUDIX family)
MLTHRARLARWLRAIPQSRHAPSLAQDLPYYQEAGAGLVTLLAAWGSIELSDAGIRASSQPAWYFLHSLAAWLETEAPVITDWSEQKGVQSQATFQHGTSLVYALEQARAQRFAQAPAIRFTAVAQILIIRPGSPPRFLVQWDARAGQFQLIGGRQKDDEPIGQTAIRELEEELQQQVKHAAGDFSLHLLAPVAGSRHLSPSFGALTEYHFTFFHASGLPELILGPDDRWLTRAELLAGRTNDGHPVSGARLKLLEEALNKRIDDLSSSFQA